MMTAYANGSHGWNHSTIRVLEHESIHYFVQLAAELGHLSGRVLDYGCGQQPYRHIVEGVGGDYVPFDQAEFPANVSGEDVGDWETVDSDFDAILCNQVIQYIADPAELVSWFRRRLNVRHGVLVLTYPTCWDEVEPDDLHRFTRWGIARLLANAGFWVERNDRRAEVDVGGFRFPLGGGAIARAT